MWLTKPHMGIQYCVIPWMEHRTLHYSAFSDSDRLIYAAMGSLGGSGSLSPRGLTENKWKKWSDAYSDNGRENIGQQFCGINKLTMKGAEKISKFVVAETCWLQDKAKWIGLLAIIAKFSEKKLFNFLPDSKSSWWSSFLRSLILFLENLKAFFEKLHINRRAESSFLN